MIKFSSPGRGMAEQPKRLSVHDAYEVVTNRILELLEKNVIPWQQPWSGGWPQNLFTKRQYRGINVLILAARDFTSPYWASERQIETHGGEVRTDEIENPTVIYYWRLGEFSEWTKSGCSVPHLYQMVKVHEVFNYQQMQGVERFIPPLQPFAPIEKAEELMQNMPRRPTVEENPRGAFYNPLRDVVALPPKSSFSPAEEYYSTAFHELVHATGHVSRLKRKSLIEFTKFGDHSYSQEELVAELGAAMLCGLIGLAPKTVENSAAYIQSWLHRLQSDKTFVVKAAGQAQKACDFIRGNHVEKPSAEPREGTRPGKAFGDGQLKLLRKPAELAAA